MKATLEEVMGYINQEPGLMDALVNDPGIDSVMVLIPGREPAAVRKAARNGVVRLSCENIKTFKTP